MNAFILAAADTMLVRQVSPDRSGFEQVVFVAGGLSQIVTLVVVALLAVIFFRMWKAQLAMQEQLSRLASKVDPMIASATTAAENVRVLTDVMRKDAVAAADALAEATGRVRDSVGGIADRIDEFGALVGRVTQKADAVADIASAAATTIRAGSRLLDERHRTPRPDVPARAPDAASPANAPRPHVAPSARDEQLVLDEPRRLADDGVHDSPYADETPPSRSSPRRRRKRRRGGGGGGGGGGGDAVGGGAPPA